LTLKSKNSDLKIKQKLRFQVLGFCKNLKNLGFLKRVPTALPKIEWINSEAKH